jgi:hypothetical protein
MKIILKVPALGTILSLLFLCSCATTLHPSAIVAASELPADATINKDAGRGNLLFVTLRLESGEELPFVVDTGAQATLLDKSLELKFGKSLGRTTLSHWGNQTKSEVYAAPKLYLEGTPVMTGSHIFIWDFKQLSSQAGRPIMGILGMDCLRHYCIQLDFETGKMRFLDSAHLDTAQLGNAFPIAFPRGQGGRPFIHQGSIVGDAGTNLMIDTGYRNDGATESKVFRREVQAQKLQTEISAVYGQHSCRVWFSKSVWNNETYTNLLIGADANLIGLRFLARHVVTFDFPKQIMYLKQTSVGPLVDGNTESAAEFLKTVKEKGQLPGWSKNDEGTIYLEPYPNYEAFDGRKNGDSSIYHYQVSKASNNSSWKLQKAWRTDQDNKTFEEYSVP